MKKILGTALALIVAFTFAGCGPSAKEKEAQRAKNAAEEKARFKALEEKHKTERLADTPAKFKDVTAARDEQGYVHVLYKDGHKGMFPVVSLSDVEKEWLTAFAASHPLAKGKGSVVVAKTDAKKTIERQSIDDGIETVQLCPPAKLRDQIGGTCMFYGRVHYLDIAGYPVEDAEIYRVINVVPHDEPYRDHRYYVGMLALFLRQKPSPLVHFPNGTIRPFEWARQELRKGRPLLAALPQDIWMSLPADFLSTHPWDGNSKIGHQVVINGFTYNAATGKGTFHIINSWRVLSEFDVPVDQKEEQRISIEQSLSPRGEAPEVMEKVVAGAITVVKPVGKQFLYEVETNLGPQKVVAASEADAKAFVEADRAEKDMDTVFGEFVIQLYDYIYDTADAKIRDEAAAMLLSDVLKIPPTISVPHVDLEVKGSLGKTYFVRVSSTKVVKLMADSTGDALEKAKRMGPAPKS